MKIIFLDIDGVLNCASTRNPRGFPYVVDKRLLARLKKLIAATKARVVLSSSWRTDPIGLYAAKYWGVPFIDVCPDMPGKSRHHEIEAWLSKHPRVKRFAVIDDEDDGLDNLPLFQPSSVTGLTTDIVRGVRRYLEGKSDQHIRRNALVRMVENLQSVFERDKD